MDDKNTQGYSEALGGFGVPQQVEATGGGNVASSKPKRSSGAKPGRVIIIIIAVVVVAALAWAFLFGPLASDNKYKDYLDPTTTQPQDVGGVTTINYLPHLKADTDWTKLDEGTRDGIARYAVKEAINEAQKDSVSAYQILGLSAKGKSIFMYDQVNNQIQIIVGQEPPKMIDVN